MAFSGLVSTFQPGVLQGVKTGLGYAPMRSGFVAGVTNGNLNRDKLQDPEMLIDVEAPFIHWNAENTTVNASNNVLTVTNLSNRTGAPAIAVASDPNRGVGGVYNVKTGITFDTTDYFSGGNLNTFSECSVMMVFSINTTATSDLFTFFFDTANDTYGDMFIQSIGGNQIQSQIIGADVGGVNGISKWNTPANLIQGNWYLLTAKFRTSAPYGAGTEQEVHINGTKQNIIPVTTTFTGTAGSLFPNTTVYWGGDRSQIRGGNSIATAMVFPYWLNESEQLRLENYCRWYYGYRF